MPIVNYNNKNYITTNFEYSNKYWKEFSNQYNLKFGNIEYSEFTLVNEILKFGLDYFINQFEQVVNQVNELGFFIFVNGFHNNSIEFYHDQLKGLSIHPINEVDLAVERRVYKLILEQSCNSELKGVDNFMSSIYEKRFIYKQTLECLLYLGYWIYSFSDFISKNSLIPNSIGVNFDDNVCNILTYQPFPILFDHIMQDIPKHDKDCIVDVNGVNEFINVLNSAFNINYSEILLFLVEKEKDEKLKNAIIFKDLLIKEICSKFGYTEIAVRNFFSGFTLCKSNKLSVNISVYKSQNLNRFLYRPILEIFADNKEIWIVNMNKWLESFTQIITNAILWQQCPSEWSKIKIITQHIENKSRSHEMLLISELSKILKQNNFIFDINIKSLKQIKGNNIPIIIQSVGEIDLCFIHPIHKTIYVCECKYNRSKFDLNNWRNDYSNFIEYENQLSNKLKWITDNLDKLEQHFQKISGNDSLKIIDFYVKGIFLINAPTFYMYDGNYRAFTIYEFKRLLSNEFRSIIYDLKNENNDKCFYVEHPYFKNLAKK